MYTLLYIIVFWFSILAIVIMILFFYVFSLFIILGLNLIISCYVCFFILYGILVSISNIIAPIYEAVRLLSVRRLSLSIFLCIRPLYSLMIFLSLISIFCSFRVSLVSLEALPIKHVSWFIDKTKNFAFKHYWNLTTFLVSSFPIFTCSTIYVIYSSRFLVLLNTSLIPSFH